MNSLHEYLAKFQKRKRIWQYLLIPPTNAAANAFSRVCLCVSVCLSVLFLVLIFESLILQTSLSVCRYILTMSVKVECQGHWVKVTRVNEVKRT